MVAQVQERLDTPEAFATVGSVRAWQHLLNGCGYQPRLRLNGHFDDVTTTATERFQKDLGLSATGKIDLATWQAAIKHDKYPGWPVIVPPEALPCQPAPAEMSETEKYDYYRSIIEANTDKFKAGANQRNLLGFRQETSTYANQGRGEYDDRLVMLWKTSDGQRRVREYKHFCTEPIRYYKDDGKGHCIGNPNKPAVGDDPDRNGIKDLGRIPEGYYEYRVGHSESLGKVLRPQQEMYSVRDIDDDGVFSTHEPKTSAGLSILFHKGGNLEQGGHTWSAGCQTLRKDDFERFWADLNANGEPGVIGYTLVRCN